MKKATKKMNETMNQYAEVLMKMEALKAQADALKDELRDYMNDKEIEVLVGKEHKATYKVVVTNRIDQTSLKRDYPAIAEKYTRESRTKRFCFD